MAVAFDAFSNQTNPAPSWTHTPVGTPRAVIVFVASLENTDTVTGAVQYGGQTLTEVTGSPLIKNSGEASVVHAFFLGTGIPTGAQTVTLTNTPSGNEAGYCITLTAGADTEIVSINTSISSDSQADPSSTLALSGRTCFVGQAFVSGHNSAASISPLDANWTSRDEVGDGLENAACYTYNTIGSTDVTVGWLQTAEDANCIAIAVSEVSGGGGAEVNRIMLLGVGA